MAFGIGGDELGVPAAEFRHVYDYAAASGLHKLMHAGEIGGAKEIWDAIELLGVARIGHGIAAIHDPELMSLLAERGIPLEICPQSNLSTGALARQLKIPSATLNQHPLPLLYRAGVPVVLSTDDPAMFHTTLISEYENAASMGLQENDLLQVVKNAFQYSFKRSAAS